MVGEVGTLELVSRHVHRDRQLRTRIQPPLRLRTGRTENEIAELVNQSIILGDRYELQRCDRATRVRRRAEERLVCLHALPSNTNLRVIVKFEANSGCERIAKSELDIEPSLELLMRLDREDTVSAATLCFCRMHCCVSLRD